jgi:hypothetical protein
MALKSTKADFICLSTEYELVLGDWYDADYAPKLFDSIIQTRELLPDTPGNRAYAAKKDPTKNKVRFISGDGSETDVIVADEWAVLVSFNPDHPMAVRISEPEMVKGLKLQFEREWKNAL